MSFTTDVCEELVRLPLKKTCCRKALLLGLLLGATEEGGRLTVHYYIPSVAELTENLLSKLFRVTAEREDRIRAGRQTLTLTFSSGAVSAFLSGLDAKKDLPLHQAASFRCAACRTEFLRGVFLGCATVNDPHKGYHMEILLPTEGRAQTLCEFLMGQIARPGQVRRGKRWGLYYKSNGAITDFLYYIGCSGTSFDVANVWIERDIRNNENRATNCVARNISRSVDASKKQREAIERLYATRKIDTLSEELRDTARLRLEHPAASMMELALLHEPPISKSGLNRRLTKLMEAAEE